MNPALNLAVKALRQKRLDRPDREKIRDWVRKNSIDVAIHSNPKSIERKVDEKTKELLALFPDMEETYKEGYEQARANLNSPEVLAITTEALEEAKKQERLDSIKALANLCLKHPEYDLWDAICWLKFRYDTGQALKSS